MLSEFIERSKRLVVLNGAGCSTESGIPDYAVVFFGETVPPEKVTHAMQRVDESDALLVVGSSLTVWSGFRFVKRAADHGVPIAIINIGPTRGDDLAMLKVEGKCGEVLAGMTLATSSSEGSRRDSRR